MASDCSGVFAILVAHRTFCELLLLKITVVFRYLGVTMSNQNTSHIELKLVTNEEYIASEVTRFDC